MTLKLKTHWKKSTEAVLETGKCLLELKQLLPRKEFIAHVKNEIGISEKHAIRMIEVYQKFGNCKTADLLKASPTVLYQLAYTGSEAQISALVSGNQIPTRNGNKNISQIKIKDISKTKRRPKVELERELATFFEEIQDNLSVFNSRLSLKKNIIERAALKTSALETSKCLKNFSASL